jgi:hypothetical protein
MRAPTCMTIMAVTAALSTGQTPRQADLTSTHAFADAVDAYVYGYPLLMIGLTERVATTVSSAVPDAGRAPINRLVTETMLPNGSYKDVVLPSTSTMYIASFLDLKPQPMVLHIPEINRFYLMQILDAWTNVSQQSPGTRRGSPPGDYALVGPDWNGTPALPPEVNMISMPTNTVWLIGRIFTSGTPDDLTYLNTEVIPKFKLIPLRALINGTEHTPPDNLPVDPSIDTVTTPLHQVTNMDACAFFGTLAAMMKTNSPLLPQDEPTVDRLAKIGIVPGQPFDCSNPKLDAQTKAALQLAVVAARKTVQSTSAAGVPPTSTYWIELTKDLGDYGKHYLLRALIANKALGANLPEDVIYGYATLDGAGLPLKSTNRYKVHFNASTAQTGQLPPVNPKAFWSVTIYNADGTLVDREGVDYNAIGVGPLGPTIQDHTACFNPDRSLDLYLQADQPSGGTQLCNWIPIPQKGSPDPSQADFIVFLRMYWPDAVVLNGDWIPPAVQDVP